MLLGDSTKRTEFLARFAICHSYFYISQIYRNSAIGIFDLFKGITTNICREKALHKNILEFLTCLKGLRLDHLIPLTDRLVFIGIFDLFKGITTFHLPYNRLYGGIPPPIGIFDLFKGITTFRQHSACKRSFSLEFLTCLKGLRQSAGAVYLFLIFL